jgi:hypothetical protein
LKQIFNSGNLSIEEFVKMIASTIKDSGLLKGSDTPMSPMSNESPEEILRRKRQQVRDFGVLTYKNGILLEK